MSILVHRRDQLEQLLIGGSAPGDRVRVILAIGGLQECVVGLPDLPVESIRTAVVEAALRARFPGRADATAQPSAAAPEGTHGEPVSAYRPRIATRKRLRPNA